MISGTNNDVHDGEKKKCHHNLNLQYLTQKRTVNNGESFHTVVLQQGNCLGKWSYALGNRVQRKIATSR